MAGPTEWNACTVSKGKFLAKSANSGSFVFSTTGQDGKSFFFICGVEGHCAAGVKVQVNVGGTVSTLSPVTSVSCKGVSKAKCLAPSCKWNKKKKHCVVG